MRPGPVCPRRAGRADPPPGADDRDQPGAAGVDRRLGAGPGPGGGLRRPLRPGVRGTARRGRGGGHRLRPGHARRAGRDHPTAAGHRSGRAARRGHDHLQAGRPEQMPPDPEQTLFRRAGHAVDDAGRPGLAGRPGRRRHPAVRSLGPAARPARPVQRRPVPQRQHPPRHGAWGAAHRDRRAGEAHADRRRHRQFDKRLSGWLGGARRGRQAARGPHPGQRADAVPLPQCRHRDRHPGRRRRGDRGAARPAWSRPASPT